MCYPKPGPRCSGHALARLNAAKAAHGDDPTHPAVLRAQDDFDATPAGLRQLDDMVAALPSPPPGQLWDRPTLVKAMTVLGRVDAAEKRRRDALSDYRYAVSAGRAPQVTDEQAEHADDQEQPVRHPREVAWSKAEAQEQLLDDDEMREIMSRFNTTSDAAKHYQRTWEQYVSTDNPVMRRDAAYELVWLEEHADLAPAPTPVRGWAGAATVTFKDMIGAIQSQDGLADPT